jgi:hypothetical protein
MNRKRARAEKAIIAPLAEKERNSPLVLVNK